MEDVAPKSATGNQMLFRSTRGKELSQMGIYEGYPKHD